MANNMARIERTPDERFVRVPRPGAPGQGALPQKCI